MVFKRILAGVFVIMILLSTAFVGANAVSSADATDNVTSTDATAQPTQAPTDPPLTAANYGYSEYVKQLEKTYYKGNLGATYTKSATTFKVWSPAAEDVKVCIYRTGSDKEQYAEMLSKTSMKFSKKYGTWYLTLKGDYKNKYYTYLVTVNGQTNEVVDPYAKAVGVNGDRGMVVDLPSTDPKGWNNDSFDRVASATDAVIWEVSVRDFSSSESSGVSEKNRGKFLAFTEEGTVVDSKEGSYSTCIDYLKQLGVNYVQINPFYDFASIDETDTTGKQYNWGYDPKNYNVPEGSYSSDPYNGNTRITECKQMIQALHNAGIGVIMDVVYNHTYYSQDSWFNQIVPDYYYRISETGEWSNGSGCGNDTASERIMFREFMKNSCVYWAQEYHVDGFRFDLMGLHDVDTMNYIRTSLDALPNGGRILMYGEAWQMDTYCDSALKLANQSNFSLLSKRIGAFNDTIRDGIKGNVFIPSDKGFVQLGNNKSAIRLGIEGQSDIDGWASIPNQCVNYSSCHDNLTLYDKLMTTVYPDDTDYRIRKDDLVSMNKLAAAITITSQGVPFMLAGEEMGRSKDGDDNSYQSDISVNEIDWTNLNKYGALSEYYQGLIKIRKTVDLFRDSTNHNVNKVSYIDETDKGVIAYTLTDSTGKSNTKIAAVVFNGSSSDTTVSIPTTLSKSWTVLANDDHAGICNLGTITDGKVTVKPHSCCIMVDSDSFAKYDKDPKQCYTYIKYYDNVTESVIYEQILKGKSGETFGSSMPESIMLRYDIIDKDTVLSGVFTDEDQTITVNCKKYEGDFSSVIIYFVDEDSNDISDSIVMTNRVGQRYYTPQIPCISGYKLDLDKLPDNGAGEYGSKDKSVTYVFKPVDGSDSADTTDNKDLCHANVIYMADDGTILDKKSYQGNKDELISVSKLEFSGYKFVSDTAQDAVFSSDETNILVFYESSKKIRTDTIVIVSAVFAALLIFVISYFIKKQIPKKRRDDDLLIDD